jgi:hypothetical protein
VAMVLDIHKWDVIIEIGHDGSEIKNPDAKEPAGRRGFHMQEIIDVAFNRGFAVTPIEAIPCSTYDRSFKFPVDFEINHEKRFRRYIQSYHGIITGEVNGKGHAVAWDWLEKKCYDPRGRICDFDDLRMDIDCFWIFQEFPPCC